jgi:hypothetical protein
MSAQGHVEDSFTFIKGLVTEGGFFVHPKNAWKEGFNVTPNVDGSIERRSGLDYEALPQYYPASIDASERDLWAFTVEPWNAVSGNGNLDFFVVQLGPEIHFYKSASGTVSAQKKDFIINLEDFGFTGRIGPVGTGLIKATSAYGKLIITNKDCEPILVIYDATTDTITTQKLELLIRDFDGIRSPKAVTDELTQDEWIAENFWPQALYNLYNQGWSDDKINQYRLANGGTAPGYVEGKLPANSKVWIYGKNTNDDFDVNVLDKQDFGTMTAPKGRAILNAFYQDREAALTIIVNTNTANNVQSSTDQGPNINDTYDEWRTQGA